METIIEKDKLGEWKVTKQKNGISVRVLKKPSTEYRKKLDKIKKENKKLNKEAEQKQEEEKLIQARIRENAIKELKKEGKLK